jgi:AcrR family transcriptional regulator
MKKTEDRRVQRTRRLLKEALIALTLERGYEAVTIADIAERADVGRSTFYVHFPDKETLLLHGFDDLGAHLSKVQALALASDRPMKERALSFSLELFEHAFEYRRLFQAIVGKQGGAMIQKKVKRMLVLLVRKDVAALAGSSEAPREAVVELIVGAFLSLLPWWLERPGQRTPADINTLFRALVMPGVTAVLG